MNTLIVTNTYTKDEFTYPLELIDSIELGEVKDFNNLYGAFTYGIHPTRTVVFIYFKDKSVKMFPMKDYNIRMFS